ncbi:uncharacterized protein Z518_01598 [Rhinocladiella mackenziei CBS 650.93]|uniref:MARVEL domain-containing protein n=1 Tax=Rhinocladiella mackenziei CBS 650.93 TaxID=1442369 RepID=A0A0D2JM56_9EURO|nr:uncharacterized protein Z518_01598 [Rhinocladiella mackenziei CBS 650.93]KIX10515.1 hypothetical protein Z518_01598 [Rhinocladiella mackenziei CBS 650.93]
MRLQLDKFGQIKNWIHIGQAIVLFLAWVLTIAVFTKDGSTDGRVGWYFGLCWLTIPILIYLTMVPMWSRARRFANVYAFASLDGLSVILWLSAWAAVASYVSSGKGKGDKEDASGCDNFKYGSASRCQLSEAIIAFGVIEMLLFVATAFISFRAVMNFKRTGMMPSPPVDHTSGKASDFSAQTQDDFSSSMRADEDFDEEQHHAGRQDYAYQKPAYDDEYAPIHQTDHDDITQMPAVQPQSPLNHSGLGIHDYDTSYNGAYGGQGGRDASGR